METAWVAHDRKFKMTIQQFHRMNAYLGAALGPGQHALCVTTGDPTLVQVDDISLDGDQDFDLTIHDEDIPVDWIVDHVERLTGRVSDHQLPLATDDEYESLKSSIARHGVEYPIIVDEQGGIIDGRLRRRACRELGIDCPTMVVGKLSLEQKRQLALELNLCRRQVGLPAKRQVATTLLRQTPWLADRLIGRQSGLDHKTVGAIRHEIQAGGEIPQVTVRLGTDQKRYKHPRINVTTAKELERAKDALQTLGDTAANKTMELRCAERKARERRMAADRYESIIVPASDDDIQLLHCRFQELNIPEGTVDLVITDPPYPKEFLPVWDDLGAFAAKVLRPGGMLVTYSGIMYLDQVLAALARNLTYNWQIVLSHRTGRQAIHGRHIYSHYKPILLFQKGPTSPHPWLDDVLDGTGKEKQLHEWQQSVDEAIHLIERLTDPGNLIVEPFGGSFTTAEAVLRVGGRRFIGCDLDQACVVRGQDRIARVREELLRSREGAEHTPPTELGGV